MQKQKDDVRYRFQLFFYDWIWDGNKIIYPEANYHVLCETDILTGDTVIIDRPIGEKDWSSSAGIYKKGQYLFVLNTRIDLEVFDLESGEWSYIDIEEEKKKWLNFREDSVFEYNGNLYIFVFSLVIIKVDVKTRKTKYLFYPEAEPDSDIRGEAVCVGDNVYIPLRHSCQIYKFNLCTEQWETVTVHTELGGINTLCFDGRLFWMTGVGRMICSWDEKSNRSVTYKVFPQKLQRIGIREDDAGFWFVKSIVYDSSIYFVPADANIMIKFDMENCKADEFLIEDEWEEEPDTRVGRFSTIKYMNAKKKDSILMMLSNKNKNLILIDLSTGKVIKTEIKLCRQRDINSLFFSVKMREAYGGVSGERMRGDLKIWMKYLEANEQQRCGEEQDKKESVGSRIWEITKY